MTTIEQAESIENQALPEIDRISDMAELEEARVRYLGKNGAFNQLLRSVGQATPEERPVIGQRLNQIKNRITEALNARR